MTFGVVHYFHRREEARAECIVVLYWDQCRYRARILRLEGHSCSLEHNGSRAPCSDPGFWSVSQYVEQAVSLETMGSHSLFDVVGSAAEAWLAVPAAVVCPGFLFGLKKFGMIKFSQM